VELIRFIEMYEQYGSAYTQAHFGLKKASFYATLRQAKKIRKCVSPKSPDADPKNVRTYIDNKYPGLRSDYDSGISLKELCEKYCSKYILAKYLIAIDDESREQGGRRSDSSERKAKREALPYNDLFGKKSDAQIAAQFGISRAAVSEARRRRGIPAYRAPVVYAHLLGTKTDVAIAKEFGVALSVVRKFRNAQNIPAYKPHILARPSKYNWSDVMAFYVVHGAAATQAKFDIKPHVLQQKRVDLKKAGLVFVPPTAANADLACVQAYLEYKFPGVVGKRKAGASLRKLSAEYKCSQDSLARLLNRLSEAKPTEFKYVRHKAAYQHLLGQKSDAQIAAEFGVSWSAVRHARRRRKIPPPPRNKE